MISSHFDISSDDEDEYFSRQQILLSSFNVEECIIKMKSIALLVTLLLPVKAINAYPRFGKANRDDEKYSFNSLA